MMENLRPAFFLGAYNTGFRAGSDCIPQPCKPASRDKKIKYYPIRIYQTEFNHFAVTVRFK